MELYLALALATTVLALNEKGTPILPILPVDMGHGKSYVRRAANVDVPLDVPPLQKSNNPETLVELYRRPNGGTVYTHTVDDGYDYSNNYYAKRAAYEDRPWSSPALVPVRGVATYKEGVVTAGYWPHGSSDFHAQDDSPKRRFPYSSRRRFLDS